MTAKIRSVLIGTGSWAENHLKAARISRRIEVVGIVGHRNRARLDELADRYHIPYRGLNVRKALAAVSPDMVDIASSPQYRLAGVEESIAAGVKLVNLEKPMALTPGEGYAIERRCRESGLLLTVNHQKKFNAPWATAAQAIRRGALGRIRFFRATCAGNLLEQGTHIIDMLLFFHRYRAPEWIMAQVADLDGFDKLKTPAPDAAIVEIVFPDGVRASVSMGNAGWRIPRETNKWFQFGVEAYGSHGHLCIDLNRNLEIVDYRTGNRTVEPSKWSSTWMQGLADHLDACAQYIRRPKTGHISCLKNSMISFQAAMGICAAAAGAGRVSFDRPLDDDIIKRLKQRRKKV